MKKLNSKYVFLGILIVAICLAIYGYKEYNRTAKDLANETAAYTITSKDLLAEFAKNDSAANAKYIAKTISIDGTLKAVDKDENGFYTLVFGDTTTTTSVRCSMDSLHNKEASILKEGTQVNVKGICTGYIQDELGVGADIILNRSCINKPQ